MEWFISETDGGRGIATLVVVLSVVVLRPERAAESAGFVVASLVGIAPTI